jgi:hypothetical protein
VEDYKKDAENLILAAYHRGGAIQFNQSGLEGYRFGYLYKINNTLVLYGTLDSKTDDGTWFKYTLNERGISLAESGGFSGIESTNKQNEKDKELDRTFKKVAVKKQKVSLLQAVLTLLSLMIGLLSYVPSSKLILFLVGGCLLVALLIAYLLFRALFHDDFSS